MLLYWRSRSEASQVLDKCGNFESKDASQFLKDDQNNFNTYFYNIDGNKSNFNVFNAELKKLQGNFSIIGICETFSISISNYISQISITITIEFNNLIYSIRTI